MQDQYRALIQYSFMKDNDGQWDKVQTDWYCGKCGVFNFKRRDNCFKCNASREESGSEGFDEISNILTKSNMIFFTQYSIDLLIIIFLSSFFFCRNHVT